MFSHEYDFVYRLHFQNTSAIININILNKLKEERYEWISDSIYRASLYVSIVFM